MSAPSNKNRIAPKLLVVASVNWEGLSRVPYLFSQSGWIVDIFASPKTSLAQSSYINDIHEAEGEPFELVEQLRPFVELRGHEYAKIILADDPLIWEVAKRRCEPWASALLPCAEVDGIIDFLISKTDFIKGCKEHNIPVPQSFVCESRMQVLQAARVVGFPLILKRNQGHSGEGVQLIHSDCELDSLNFESSVVVQKFIKGRICSAAALYKKGVLLGFYSYFRLRTWGAFGSSTAIKFQAFPELCDILERLGRISQFDGLCGIDFMLDDATSNIYILEQNFRPTLTMLLGPKVGVDFISLLRNWDTPLASPLTQRADVHAVVPMFPSDIVRAISQRDFSTLLRWLFDPRWIREAGWHDKKLLLHNFRYILRTIMGKISGVLSRAGSRM
jgi:hypothetical protein